MGYKRIDKTKSVKRASSKPQTVKKKYPYQIRRSVKASALYNDVRRRYNAVPYDKKNQRTTNERIGLHFLSRCVEFLDFAESSGDYAKVRKAYGLFKDIDKYLLGKPYNENPNVDFASEQTLKLYDRAVQKYKELSNTLEYYDSPSRMPKKVDEWYQGYHGRKDW